MHFFENWFGQNPCESIHGLESEYISVFAIEYEYNYPVRDMDHSPEICDEIDIIRTWNRKEYLINYRYHVYVAS